MSPLLSVFCRCEVCAGTPGSSKAGWAQLHACCASVTGVCTVLSWPCRRLRCALTVLPHPGSAWCLAGVVPAPENCRGLQRTLYKQRGEMGRKDVYFGARASEIRSFFIMLISRKL